MKETFQVNVWALSSGKKEKNTQRKIINECIIKTFPEF